MHVRQRSRSRMPSRCRRSFQLCRTFSIQPLLCLILACALSFLSNFDSHVRAKHMFGARASSGSSAHLLPFAVWLCSSQTQYPGFTTRLVRLHCESLVCSMVLMLRCSLVLRCAQNRTSSPTHSLNATPYPCVLWSHCSETLTDLNSTPGPSSNSQLEKNVFGNRCPHLC